MKNLLKFFGVIILVLVISIGLNHVTKTDNLSDFAIENIEALAQSEIWQIPCVLTCKTCWCLYPPVPEDWNWIQVQGEFMF